MSFYNLDSTRRGESTLLIPVIGSVLIAVLVGLAVMWIVKNFTQEGEISWSEFVTVAVVMSVVFAPLTGFIGEKLSVAEIVRYEQFVNGVETRAVDTVEMCSDGSRGLNGPPNNTNCEHRYASDSYTWTSESCTTDDKGKQTCTTDYHHETVYSPYLKREHTYRVEASMGGGGAPKPYSYGVYADIDAEPFDRSTPAIPASIPRGAPADWLEAKRRIEIGDPRPVTMIASYDNYILASKDPVLLQYSDRIPQYLEAGLLPDPTRNIMEEPAYGPTNMRADKVAFAGVNVNDPAAWQDSVMRFNAALGMQLQGDLHVVVVSDEQIPFDQAIPYVSALKAHWQSEAYGKRALAKNGVILVIGTDGQNVTWAEATTGMPFGNEMMAQWVRDWLPGTKLEPTAIFGTPRTVIAPGIPPKEFTEENFTVTNGEPRGVLEGIVFEKAPFKRASMSCDDEDCVGFKNWLSKIEPTPGQKIGIMAVIVVISMVLWMIVAFTSFVDGLVGPLRSLIRKEEGKKIDDDLSSLPMYDRYEEPRHKADYYNWR